MADVPPVAADGAGGAVDEFDRMMRHYADYVNELYTRHPDTFDRLKNFIDRGNCTCSQEPYACIEISKLCTCKHLRYNRPGYKCQCGDDTKKCVNRSVEFRVRVYDIHRTKPGFFEFLRTGIGRSRHPAYFDAADDHDFKRLKEKLHENFNTTGERKLGHNYYRLITVNHLSANITNLLGRLYDILADFFNHHLPGTEAISGRLISMANKPIIRGSDLRGIKMETIRSRYQEDDTGYNKGLTNGLVGSEKDDSSWDAVYYDFFELKASIDALSNRADKIQEGMLGLLSIRISENSAMLSSIGFGFSVIIIPWTVVGGLYTMDAFKKYPFAMNTEQFGWILALAVVGVVIFNVCFVWWKKEHSAHDLIPRKRAAVMGKWAAVTQNLSNGIDRYRRRRPGKTSRDGAC